MPVAKYSNDTFKIFANFARCAVDGLAIPRSHCSQTPLDKYIILETSDWDKPSFSLEILILSNSKKTLYAHLQLDEYQAMISNTFIKWVHTDSGRVLLFTKKNINPITRQNWVSLTPDENWQTGNYQVIFYQFNQNLTPIIQGHYYVGEKNNLLESSL